MVERTKVAPARLEAPRLGLVARVRAAGMRHEPLRGYALLSPTMVWMLVTLAIPLVILYGVSIVVAYFFTKQRERRAEREEEQIKDTFS